MTYLDHSASSALFPEVMELYLRELPHLFANPSSAHQAGLESERKLKQSLQNIARTLHCSPDELWVCSGATEAINTAIKGYLLFKQHRGKSILLSHLDHPAVVETANFVAKTANYQLTYLKAGADGRIDQEDLEQKLSEETAMVCLIHVNNETGALAKLDELIPQIRAKAPKAKILLDSVQALGKTNIKLKSLDVDFAIFSGHKIHAPKGIGLLYVKKGVSLTPLLHGGGQQKGRRSGTENPLLVMAFDVACQKVCQEFDARTERCRQIHRSFLEALGDLPYVVNSPSDAVPQILNLSFPGVRSETLLNALSAEGIYFSMASSCHSKAPYSEVLLAMGLERSRLESAIRVSFDPDDEVSAVQLAAERIRNWVLKLRR